MNQDEGKLRLMVHLIRLYKSWINYSFNLSVNYVLAGFPKTSNPEMPSRIKTTLFRNQL